MPASAQQTTIQAHHEGRWVTEKVYAEIYGFTKATLANWRYRDRLVGRSEARPGFPRYKRFGRAVRYSLPAEDSFGDPGKVA